MERKGVKAHTKTKPVGKKCEKAAKKGSDQKNKKRKEVPPTNATQVAKKAKKEKTAPKPDKKASKQEQVSQKKDMTKTKKTEAVGTQNADPPPTQPARRLSGKTKPQEALSSTPSETTQPSPCKELFADDASGIASPAFSLASLHAWKKEAAERGLSLEQYMEDVSEKAIQANLEAHMTKLVAEQQAEHAEQNLSSDSSDSSDQEGSEESEEKHDDDEQDKPTKEKNPEDSEVESEDDGSHESEDGSESDENVDGEEMDEEDEAVIDGIDKQLALPAPADTQTAAPADDKGTPETPAAPVAVENAMPAAPTGESQVAIAATKRKASPPQPAATAPAVDFANANSVSHKPEWDRFSRQCIDRKKFPCSLASHYLRDKTDLFREWLQQSGDWSKNL